MWRMCWENRKMIFVYSCILYIAVPAPFPMGLADSELAWLVWVYRPVDTEVKHVTPSNCGTNMYHIDTPTHKHK